MTTLTASHIGHSAAPSRLLGAVRDFFTAWGEATAAYAVYQELSAMSRTDLAARGLRRQDIGRSAMNLPELMRD